MAAMEYRFLGRTGVRVSALAFGTMSFGGDADEATAKQLFSRCMDAGINFYDCANVYQGGKAEEILGRCMAGVRDEIVLATKAYFPMGPGPNQRGSSRYHLVRSVEDSLRRLNTDRIDVLFLHRFDEATELEETLRAVEHLVQQGKILYPAVSNFAAWETMKALGLARARHWQPLVAMQPMYNLVKRQAEVELLPMAKSEGVAVFPYSPLAAGLLTGKYGKDKRPEGGRIVDNAIYGERYRVGMNFDVAERFTEYANAKGIHPVSLAIAWVARNEAITAPLLGARNVAQLEPALKALEVPMDAQMRAEVSALSPTPPPATDRAEEQSGMSYGKR